ncbi:hypothetical protein FQR65_LT18714 [Abscondita terminalis]|nr:hypothetical protein FQR65_LT18714 [Abscondita terminalis]
MARRIDKIFKALELLEVSKNDINETPVNKSVYPDFNPTLKHCDSFNSDLLRSIEEVEVVFLNDGDKINDVIGNASLIETQIAMPCNRQFMGVQSIEIVVAESNRTSSLSDGKKEVGTIFLKFLSDHAISFLEETMASNNFSMEVDQLFDEMPSCSSVQSNEIKVTFDIQAPIEENIYTELDINDPDFNPTLEECDSCSDSESDTTAAVIKLPDNILEDETPKRKRSTKRNNGFQITSVWKLTSLFDEMPSCSSVQLMKLR